MTDAPTIEIVTYTEEFRRSQRAALTWSGLSIFAALSKDETLTFPWTDLTLPISVVHVTLFIGATLYFARWCRAVWIQRRFNKLHADRRSEKWTSLEGAFDQIEDDVGNLMLADQKAIDRIALSQQAMDGATHDFATLIENLEQLGQQIDHVIEETTDDKALEYEKLNGFTRVVHVNASQVKEFKEKLTSWLNAARDAISRMQQADTALSESSKSTVDSAITELHSLRKEVAGFQRSIEKLDRGLHIVLEIVPTAAVWLIAVYSLTTILGAPLPEFLSAS